MKFKLDENLGQRLAGLFRQNEHDVATVSGQRLNSATDRVLIDTSQREGRVLVTLDLDFSNPLLFRPSDYSGIAVLRLPRKPAPGDLVDAALTLIEGLARGSIKGRLWVVQRGRIREYQEERGD